MIAVMIGEDYRDIDKVKRTINILKNIIEINQIDPARLSGLENEMSDIEDLFYWYLGIFSAMNSMYNSTNDELLV